MKNDERICWNCGSRILKFYQNHHITMACSPNEGYMKVVSVHQFTVLKQCEPICLGTRLVPSRQISGRPATRVNGWSRLIHRSLGFCQIFRETKWNERDPPLNKDNWPIDQLGSRFVKSSHWSRKPSSLIHCRAGELPALPGLVVATSATGIYWISRKICWNPKHVGDQDARLQEKNSEIWKQKKSLQLPWTIPELRTFCQLQRLPIRSDWKKKCVSWCLSRLWCFRDRVTVRSTGPIAHCRLYLSQVYGSHVSSVNNTGRFKTPRVDCDTPECICVYIYMFK